MPNSVNIGVTGHRDLCEADMTAIAQQVTQAIAHISEQHSGERCMLWTGLAEGADRLVAHCAWQAGWQVGAVLALPLEEFEQDFEASAGRQEFRSLLQRCVQVQVAAEPGTPRPDCYVAVGEWLCLKSDTLLALWDGDLKAALRPGGTAWVVQRFQKQRVALSSAESTGSALSSLPVGQLIHIPVRRAASLPLHTVAN